MLPSNAISVVPQQAAYLTPDATDGAELESFEAGGVALNDASQGRLVQSWRAWYDAPTNSIKVSPISGTPVTTLITGLGAVTSLSLAFDSSMAPVVCYIETGTLKLRWFNTVTSAYQTDTFPNATSARVSTDDKRKGQEGASDVIFAYTLNGSLYWRQQRERYGVARVVGLSGKRRLTRLGMSRNARLQFELSV